MKTFQIHLIRHGMTQGNKDGTYVGQSDIPVTEEGLAQLRQMKAKMTYPEVSAVFVSPLIRCKQTAGIIYPDNTAIVIDDLKEYNFGEWEGKSADELKNDEQFCAWLAGQADAAPPFGETNAEFTHRVTAAFLKIVEGLFKTDVTEAAIVAHGGVIMTIMSLFALPELPMWEWLCPNGCGYTLEIIPSYWTKIYKTEVSAEIPVPNEGADLSGLNLPDINKLKPEENHD